MQVPVGVDGCVLGLQIAIYDGIFVEVLEDEEEAAEVETSSCVITYPQIG
jgi:hypothetical protein